MIHYILHTTILLALAYGFYWIFLKKETFYKLNRHFLILAIFATLCIPLINVPASMSFNNSVDQIVSSSPTLSNNNHEGFVSPTNTNPTFPAINKNSEVQLSDSPVVSESFFVKMSQWNWSKILWIIYLSGALVFLTTFIIQLSLIIIKKNNLESIKDGNYTILELTDKSSPFSFYNWIFINPSLYEPETFEQIIAHEKVHVSQSHYIDKILAEILVILFWFSPFSWLYRKAITNNLEFLTDSEIIGQGVEPQSYQMSLLKVSVPQHPLTLTTNYNESFLIQRIKMMNERKSSAKSSWKYLLIIPIVFLTMASLNAVQTDDNLIIENQDQNNFDSKEKNKRKEKNKTKNKKKNISTSVSTSTSGSASAVAVAFSSSDSTKPTNHRQDNNINLNLNLDLNLDIENLIHSNWNTHNIEPGHWTAIIDGDQIEMAMNNSDPKGRWTWMNTMYFDKNEFSNIAYDQENEMRVVRDAGKLILTGFFDNNKGSGKFEFLPNNEFSNYLRKQDVNKISDKEMFHLFINNMNKKYIDDLIGNGYKLNTENLVEMSIHGLHYAKYKSYEKIFKNLGVTNTRPEKLIEFAIHNVTKEFVDDIVQFDFPDLSLSKIIEAKIHNVDPEMVESLKSEGYEVSMSSLIEFAIHGVSSNDIKSYKQQGYNGLSADDMVDFSIHGVTTEFISDLADLGYNNLSPNRLIEFKIHGVTPEFISQLNDLGYKDIAPNKLVEFVIHGVSSNFVSELNDLGYSDIPSYRLVEFRIHGVTSGFVRELKSLGYSDISPNKLVEARIHGVTPNFIRGFQEMGYTNLTISKLVELSIHDIHPKDFNQSE